MSTGTSRSLAMRGCKWKSKWHLQHPARPARQPWHGIPDHRTRGLDLGLFSGHVSVNRRKVNTFKNFNCFTYEYREISFWFFVFAAFIDRFLSICWPWGLRSLGFSRVTLPRAVPNLLRARRVPLPVMPRSVCLEQWDLSSNSCLIYSVDLFGNLCIPRQWQV